MTKSEVEAMLRRERNKTSMSSIFLDQSPLRCRCCDETLPSGVFYSTIQSFDSIRGNTKEHVVHLLDSIGAHAYDVDLYMREFSKSLTRRAYTSYVNLKSSSVMTGQCLLSLFNTKVFYAKQSSLWSGSEEPVSVSTGGAGCICKEVS